MQRLLTQAELKKHKADLAALEAMIAGHKASVGSHQSELDDLVNANRGKTNRSRTTTTLCQ
jgi:hypothetical protein